MIPPGKKNSSKKLLAPNNYDIQVCSWPQIYILL